MNPVQLFYNNPYFENLQETEPFLKYLEAEEQKVRETKLYGTKVLDIGCGNGRSTRMLSGFAKEVVGIDFSERLLEQAKEKARREVIKIKGPNIIYFLEDAKSIHFRDSEFDHAFMLWNTFGDLYSARDKVLQEAKRVVKPDGKIFFSVFSESVIPAYLEMLEVNDLRAEHVDENYIFLREGLVSERFSEEKLERIMDKAGLKLDIQPLTNIAYWCEARRK